MLRTAAFALATLLATSASADRMSAHATANGEVGITDNVFSANGGKEADLFFTLRPGFLVAFNRPRFIQELQGEGEMIMYATHGEDPSLGFRGAYRAFVTTGPRSEMLWQLNAGKSLLSAVTNQPMQSLVQIQPDINVTAETGDGSEYWSWIATRELRLSETLFGRFSRTNDNLPDVPDPFGMAPPVPARTLTTSYEAGTTVALERTFRSDAISLEPGASVLRLERDVGAAVTPPSGMGSRLDRQINVRGRVQWRHDFNRTMSGSLDGGAVYVIPYGSDPNRPGAANTRGIYPVIGGNLNYIEFWGSASLGVRRDVTPNLLLAQNTVTDGVTLAAAVPIPNGGSRRRQPKWSVLGSLGGQRTQLVDPSTGELASDFRAARLDLGLNYVPQPGITYTARYELQYQSGDKSGMTSAEGFYRNTIFFSFAVRYPVETAVTVPTRRANSSRADRSDTGAVGAEPVVPDVLDQSGSSGQEDR